VFIEVTASLALKPALSAQRPQNLSWGLPNKVVNDNGRYQSLGSKILAADPCWPEVGYGKAIEFQNHVFFELQLAVLSPVRISGLQIGSKTGFWNTHITTDAKSSFGPEVRGPERQEAGRCLAASRKQQNGRYIEFYHLDRIVNWIMDNRLVNEFKLALSEQDIPMA
jgi:hypothetical protein